MTRLSYMFSFFASLFLSLIVLIVAFMIIRRMARKFEYRRQVRSNMHLAVSRLAPAGRHAAA